MWTALLYFRAATDIGLVIRDEESTFHVVAV